MILSKQYDKDDLLKLQKTEVNILKDIITVCNKHNIQYFVAFGTLIGVMRHKGFIPWDDDLDIGMSRKDYVKLCKVFKQELGDKYILATPLTLKGYCSGVTKVMLKGTKFVPNFSMNMKCPLGIHIDIFVYDKIDINDKFLKWNIFKSRFYSQLLFLAGSPNPIIDGSTLIGKIEIVLCKLIHYLICWIPGIAPFLYKRLNAVGKKTSCKNNKYLTSFFDNAPLKDIVPIDEVYPLKTAEFEDIQVQIPANADYMLTKIYGDYMKMPPVEKRVNHCADILDFGDK